MIENNDYVILPFATNYSINHLGDVIRNDTKEKLSKTRNEKYSKTMVSLKINSGDQRSMSVAFILAKMFVPVPPELINEDIVVFYRDGNRDNHSIDNLEWKSKNFERDLNVTNKILGLRAKHNVPLFNETFTGYYPYHTECLAKPGFYFIPNSEHPLVISKEGLVYNLETNKFMNRLSLAGGYTGIAIRNNGEYKNEYFHRLMAKMFIDNPENKPEVNHKNGIKEDNTISNLEWVTSLENSTHAIETGLCNFNPVLAKNILTNEIIRFSNVKYCAIKFNITPAVLMKRLVPGKAGLITKDWFVFKYDDNTSWPILEKNHIQENRWGIYSSIWYGYHLKTKTLMLEDTGVNLCKNLNIDPKVLFDYDFNNKNKIIIDGWRIHRDDVPDMNDYLKMNPKEKRIDLLNKYVKVTNLTTNEIVITKSQNEAAKLAGILASTLSLNLSKNSGKVIINNFTFETI